MSVHCAVITNRRDAAAAPAWMPPLRGVRRDVSPGASMPLVPAAGLHLTESPVWLPTHRHRAWELYYVSSGRIAFDLPDEGRELRVPAGWFSLTAAGRVHRARDGLVPPARLLWVQIDPGAGLAGSPFTAAEAARLRTALGKRADQVWPAPPVMVEVFAEVETILLQPVRSLAAARLRTCLAQVLIHALGGPGPAGGEAGDPALLPALALLSDLGHRRSVAAAARAAGMTGARFSAAFQRQFGCSPDWWRLERRIDRARALLGSGESPADTAQELGFASPGSFAHAFRRVVGVGPAHYNDLHRAMRAAAVRDW